MIELFQRGVARLMNCVHVNRIRCSADDGVAMFEKRRRPGGSVVIWFGNRFLALADSGIRMFERTGAWMDWELHCIALLYPDRPGVKIGSGRGISVPEVRGVSLRQLLDNRDEADGIAFVAAARELRRVHKIECGYFKGAWSHGDLHLANILYDAETGRAHLIDFDTRHERGINATQRHCDDLKVFLLELISLPEDRWRRPAAAFVGEYGEASVLRELSRQLFVPSGFAKILWFTRTNYLPIRNIEDRLQILRETIFKTVPMESNAS